MIGNWLSSGRRLNSLTHTVEELNKRKPIEQQHCADRIACITRFLNAQYTRSFGEQLLPVKDLRLLHAGAMLHDLGRSGEGAEAILAKLEKQHRLNANDMRILREICFRPENVADAPLYVQAVAMAERYDLLAREENCTCADVVQQICSGENGIYHQDMLACLQKSLRELKALEECEQNHNRVFLLQKIYRGDRRDYWRRKRAFDIIVALLCLIISSPLFLLIMLIIYLDDPKGSPFFCQVRVGRHKKEFLMYKFRTMYMDAEARRAELEKHNEKDGPVFKIANDPRITRVGRFLRKTSLDELPQLFNVLKGEMTLVGPRPPLPSEVAHYTSYEEMRLSVTPGLTCVWQVQPKRDEIRFADWVDMDLKYIGTRSIWLDLWLVFRTVLVVIRSSGS